MTEVLICHSPDNAASARLLADAIAGDGYSVTAHDAPSDAITGEIAEAKAAIVIWSESASASEWIRAEANVARGLKKLVQVSADGRPPPVPFDRAQLISILTWRGETDHPAWQGIKEALIALCGPAPERPAAAAPVAAPEPAPEPVPPTPVSPSATAPRAGPNPLLLVLIVGLVLAALAAGAWFWLQNRAPTTVAATNEAIPSEREGPQIIVPETPAQAPSEPPPPAETPPPPPPAAFDRQAIVRDPAGAAILRNAPSSVALAVARIESGERVATYAQQSDWWQVRTASGRTGYLPVSSLNLAATAEASPPPAASTPRTAPVVRPARTERRAPPAPPRRSRIRKENAEVMVQFCAGAGRGTPQCRRFQREAGY